MDETQRRTRKQARLPCSLPVEIDGVHACAAFDVSEGGLYVNCTKGMQQGAVVTISMGSGEEAVTAKARVKHIQEGIGAGLMFIDLDQALKNRIIKLVASLQGGAR